MGAFSLWNLQDSYQTLCCVYIWEESSKMPHWTYQVLSSTSFNFLTKCIVLTVHKDLIKKLFVYYIIKIISVY